MKTKVVRTALAHWEGRDSFVAHHDNLLNTNRIGRVRLMPSRGGSNGADFAHAKPMGRPQDRMDGSQSHGYMQKAGTHVPALLNVPLSEAYGASLRRQKPTAVEELLWEPG